MHKATARFWRLFNRLPENLQEKAKRNFDLIKKESLYPSLHFKKVGNFWSARVGISHRALAIKDGQDFIWVWIGSHTEYERMIREMD